MSDLDLLRSLGDEIVPPPIDALRETARRRTRRTTSVTVVSAAAAVAVVAGAAFLATNDDAGEPRPVEPPVPEVITTRPLTYAEGATIHYGDQTVTAPAAVAELDLTDDGVVARTEDGGIWFTDGSTLDQVGTLGDPGPAYEVAEFPNGTTWGFVVSGNLGSRVAWFEFPQPGRPELVVYDAGSGEESARHPLGVAPGSYALLASITDAFAYWYDEPESIEDDVPTPQVRLELTTGAQGPVDQEEYDADQPGRGTPRTMMVSHADAGGPPYRVFDGTASQFEIRGGRVEPVGLQPLDARDGATRSQFAFDAPPGYPDAPVTWLTQWIDDDTVVITVNRQGNDDLLECHFSAGACTLAVQLPEEAILPEIG